MTLLIIQVGLIMELPKEAKRGIQDKIRAKMTGYRIEPELYISGPISQTYKYLRIYCPTCGNMNCFCADYNAEKDT